MSSGPDPLIVILGGRIVKRLEVFSQYKDLEAFAKLAAAAQ
jgi:hypothetical protein